jgi:hypothetical protein
LVSRAIQQEALKHETDLEKPVVAELVMELLLFYATPEFVVWFLFRANGIESTFCTPTFLRLF